MSPILEAHTVGSLAVAVDPNPEPVAAAPCLNAQEAQGSIAEAPAKKRPIPADAMADETPENKSLAAESQPLASNGHTARPRRPRSAAKSKALPAANQNPLWQIQLLPTEQIGPSPFQPRQEFSEEEMEELAASVAEHGVQTPILVRPVKPILVADAPQAPAASSPKNGKRGAKGIQPPAVNGSKSSGSKSNGGAANGRLANSKAASGKVPAEMTASDENKGAEDQSSPLFSFELVTGERRLRASVKAGRPLIPAIVRGDLSDAQAAELALIENVQRSNLNVIEEGRGYRSLMLRFRFTEARIAKKVGKSIASVQAAIKLLELPQPVQAMLLKKQLSAAHGHELLKLAPHPDICTAVALKAQAEKLSAASLVQNPLPNARELKRRGQIVELGYGTKFDWKSECRSCPFKAFVTSGYGSYCLKPLEWRAKQEHAIEMEKQEAARVLEAARQDSGATVDATALPVGSYRSLQWNEPPAGCSPQCPCRGQVSDPRDSSKSVPVCLDPARLEQLRKDEREAQESERQRRYQSLWETSLARLSSGLQTGSGLRSISDLPTISELPAMYGELSPPVTPMVTPPFMEGLIPEGLIPEGLVPEDHPDSDTLNGTENGRTVNDGTSNGSMDHGSAAKASIETVGIPIADAFGMAAGSGTGEALGFQAATWSKIAPLLVLPVLRGENCSYAEREGWEKKAREVTLRLGLELPWDGIMDDDDEAALLLLLEPLPPFQLLHLGALLLLMQEAIHAGHWGGATPFLEFVLDLQPARQSEMEMIEADGEAMSDEANSDEAISDAGQGTSLDEEEENGGCDDNRLDGERLDDEQLIAMLERESANDDSEDNDSPDDGEEFFTEDSSPESESP